MNTKALEKVSLIPQDDAPASQLPAVSETAAVLHMIERVARDPSVDLQKLKELMVMRRDAVADQRREAFEEAMAAAKAEIPTITKNREVDFTSQKGRTHYRYEDLGNIAKTVQPILAKHGLSYRYRTTSNVNEPVTVTCIVSHRAGHFEENTLCAGRDDTGGKNPIQQMGSTITYLQRMTLKAALGLAVSNDDDGKASAGAETITEQQAKEIAAKCKEVAEGFDESFCTYFGIETIADLPAKDFQRALIAIGKKRTAK
jgi:hypothetical protein